MSGRPPHAGAIGSSGDARAGRSAAGLLDRLHVAGLPAPRLAVLLGSGYAPLAAELRPALRVPYAEIEGMPPCRVDGHAGALLLAPIGRATAAIFSGRPHGYEDLARDAVVFPVDLAAALGARVMLLTCAAGGIRVDLERGDLVVVEDHLNLGGWTPSTSPAGFLDLAAAYDPDLRALLSAAAAAHGIRLASGVLAMMPGPAYETPAEVRMLRALGADLVSMSTVPEVIRARALGLRVAALACVSNRAAGLEERRLAHAEVLDVVSAAVQSSRGFFVAALDGLARIAATASSRVPTEPST